MGSKKGGENNKEEIGTYYLARISGMIRASGAMGKNEKSEKEKREKVRGAACKEERVTKTGDDDCSRGTKDGTRRVQCERLNEFRYTRGRHIRVCRTVINGPR